MISTCFITPALTEHTTSSWGVERIAKLLRESSLWPDDLSMDAVAERVAKQFNVGMAHINGGTIDLGLPFGGYKLSGMGRKLGKQGLSEYLEIKSIYRTKFGFVQKLGLAWYLLAPLVLL